MAPKNARHQSSVHSTPILPYPSRLCKRCVARLYVREGKPPCRYPYPGESEILMTVCKTGCDLWGTAVSHDQKPPENVVVLSVDGEDRTPPRLPS
jgi:hypothetical protein